MDYVSHVFPGRARDVVMVTNFCVKIGEIGLFTFIQFCFTYTLEGVTAMPHGLHVMFCHAFLVNS